MPDSFEHWREIAWDGISLQLPRNWQPTVIHKSYLFFEQDGQPAFAIKWERVRGRFSAERILGRLYKSLQPSESTLSPWDPQTELPELSLPYSITGFKCRQGPTNSLGILLYCPDCNRATMFQLYMSNSKSRETLHHILHSFVDHHQLPEQTWSVYDIRAQLPVQAELKSHEFLVGRYTLSFVLNTASIDLYRYKPAAALLKNQSLQEFGAPLAGDAVVLDQSDDRVTTWEYRASGLNRLPALVGRKPGWIWLQLSYIEEKNAILAVKGSGKRNMDRQLLENIAGKFTVTETA